MIKKREVFGGHLPKDNTVKKGDIFIAGAVAQSEIGNLTPKQALRQAINDLDLDPKVTDYQHQRSALLNALKRLSTGK